MSSASKVRVANRAIIKVGGNPINAFDENSPEARAINAAYPEVRDEVLCEDLWTFAQKRANLVQLDEDPVWTDDDMSVIYAKPSDYLKMNFKNISFAKVKVEEAGILSDSEGLGILYTARIDDPTKYFPSFTTALVYKLAAEIAFTLTKSRTLMESLEGLYLEKYLPKATKDAQQGDPVEAAQSAWETARISGFSQIEGRTGQEIWTPCGCC